MVLLAGCVLLGAGVTGVARMDAPLRAAVEPQHAPPARGGVEVSLPHHRRGDCPPPPSART